MMFTILQDRHIVGIRILHFELKSPMLTRMMRIACMFSPAEFLVLLEAAAMCLMPSILWL